MKMKSYNTQAFLKEGNKSITIDKKRQTRIVINFEENEANDREVAPAACMCFSS